MAGLFLLVFLADAFFGLRTMDLRIACVGLVAVAGLVVAIGWKVAWHSPIDLLGLAHLLEKERPESAERLVTLVQLDGANPAPANADFVRLLEAETQRELATLNIDRVCPFHEVWRRCLTSAVVVLAMFGALCMVSPFGLFCQRFFVAWTTPLTPFTIALLNAKGHALRGESYVVEATYERTDIHAPEPTRFVLVCEDSAGGRKEILMQETSPRSLRVALENLQAPMVYHVAADRVASEPFEVQLVDRPVFTAKPAVLISPPFYLRENSKSHVFDETNYEGIAVLQYSKLQIRFSLDQAPRQAWLAIRTLPAGERDVGETTYHPVQWQAASSDGVCDLVAAASGSFSAELKVELDHDLTAALPIGRWTVHADQPPRFTESLRLQGQGMESSSLTQKQARISSDDVLRLQTTVEDAEGLEVIEFEYRVNDGPSQVREWLQARGKKQLAINDWLPLPKTLKQGDRLRFRLRASDTRQLKKGEVLNTAALVIPPVAQQPQVVTAPAVGGEDSWIDLHVDPSVEGFLKQQILAQREEVQDTLAKIKKKLQSEWQQLQKLQRSLHEQEGNTPEQLQQAAKIKAANQEIVEDLLHAGEKMLNNPGLAHLAEPFFDLAETELQKSAQALQRFEEKDLPQAARAKEVPIAQDAVLKAQQKLERMQQRNRELADDRLDQWQLEKLAKRQKELADRLEKLLAEPQSSGAELAKEIEAIRQEQARLADQAEEMRTRGRLAEQALAALQEKNMRRLAQSAQDLAQKQRTMESLTPDKMPKDVAELLSKLAQRQADLADQVQPFAQKNQGPKVSSAQDAAFALKERQIEQGLDHQKEHEKRLQQWLEKMLPGLAANTLRAQAHRLAGQQKGLSDDLEQLGKDLTRLNDKMLQDRLQALLTRQHEVQSAIAGLKRDLDNEPARQTHGKAEEAARQAADQLKVKDAVHAFESMNKAQKALEMLAGMLPDTRLPKARDEVKDPALRARIEQVERYALAQKDLRKETEKLLADWMKSAAQMASQPVREQTNKLESELHELSQKGVGPETKAMAKDAAQAADKAKQAMELSQALKEKGQADQAKMTDETAAKQLDIVVKQLEKVMQESAMKDGSKESAAKTADALKDSEDKMRLAQKRLPTAPQEARQAMKGAAQRLEQAAEQAQRASSRMQAPPARNPAAKALARTKSGSASATPPPLKDMPSAGKAWGDLPGELKTRLMQDFRSRYGEEYAEIIREYFERLAEAPKSQRKQ